MKRLATTSTVVARKPHDSKAVNAAGGWRPAMDHAGIDVHKVGELLGLSHQRVHQLARR